MNVIPASRSDRNRSGADHMGDQTVATAECDQATGTEVACLERLAAALSTYRDLDIVMRPDGPAPRLAVRNTAHLFMPETVGVIRLGDGLPFAWSWGQRIGDVSDLDSAALAIAYVLKAGGVRLGGPSPVGWEAARHEGATS